jgi:hypothetical protein
MVYFNCRIVVFTTSLKQGLHRQTKNMLSWLFKSRLRLPFKLISAIGVLSFIVSGVAGYPVACAESIPYLPAPGQLINAGRPFLPVVLKGIKFDPDNPFHLKFILDEGNTAFTDEQLKAETDIMVRYFLSALTIPAGDLWVNLSPYEHERIAPQPLGSTDLGRDLLAQDYILKQLSASLTYPESLLGKKYWDNVYDRAFKIFGTTRVPIHPYHKIWIAPDLTQVWESGSAVFIKQATMKVMLEEDFTALSRNNVSAGADKDISSQVMRAVILPEISKDVNSGENFAYLRQMHSAVVLASWFKLRLKNSLYNRLYVDKKKIAGVDTNDPYAVEKVYQQYVEAFKRGVYNYAKKDFDPNMHRTINRQYYSGGIGEEIDRAVVSSHIDFTGISGAMEVSVVRPDELGPALERSAGGRLGEADVRLETASSGGRTAAPRGYSHVKGKILGSLTLAMVATGAATAARADSGVPVDSLLPKVIAAQNVPVEKIDVVSPGTGRHSTVTTVLVPPSEASFARRDMENIFSGLSGRLENPPLSGSPAGAGLRRELIEALDKIQKSYAAQLQAVSGLFNTIKKEDNPRARNIGVYLTHEELKGLIDEINQDQKTIAKIFLLAERNASQDTIRNIVVLKHGVDPAVLAVLASDGRQIVSLGGAAGYGQEQERIQAGVQKMQEINQNILESILNLSQTDDGTMVNVSGGRSFKFNAKDKERLEALLEHLGGDHPDPAGAKKIMAGADRGLREFVEAQTGVFFAHIKNIDKIGGRFIPSDSATGVLLQVLAQGSVLVVGSPRQINETRKGIKDLGGAGNRPDNVPALASVVHNESSAGVTAALHDWRESVKKFLAEEFAPSEILTPAQLDGLEAVHLMPGGWRRLTKDESKKYKSGDRIEVTDVDGNKRFAYVRQMYNGKLGVTIGSEAHNKAKRDAAEKIIDQELTRELMDSGLLGVEQEPPAESATGGITEEGLTIETAGDGTQIPMFKNVPIDIAGFNGFSFQIAGIGRNKSVNQIVASIH